MTVTLLVLLVLLAFANGANDNSKGVATLVGYGAATPRQALRWATLTTALPLPEALTASATTAAMVSLASWNGLPVSTTHVSTGAIIGAGARHDARAVQWGKVGEIVLSWVVTLPVAALLAAAVKALMAA